MNAVKLALSLALLVVGASACGGSSRHADGVRSNARALTVWEAATPRLKVRRYDTSGTYPQVRGSRVDLIAVNSALRRAVLRAQQRYAREARRELAEVPSPKEYRGVYQTWPKARLMSASTVVVSALVPVLELYPGGDDGGTWLSVTVRVPSGAPVGLRDLFAKPSQGLSVLAKAVKKEVMSSNACVRQSFRNALVPANRADMAYGFDPTASNYRYFALTASGLAIGFPLGQVGAPPCNRVETTAPYDVVRPYLSRLGEELVAGVRRPRR